MSAPEQEPRTWTIEMPAGMELLTMNQRLHWSARGRRTRALREAACWLARKEHVPHLEKASVKAVYYPPDNRRRDPHNWHPSVKACVDGLVDARVIDDDSPRYLVPPVIDIGEPCPRGRLVLHIEEAVDA